MGIVILILLAIIVYLYFKIESISSEFLGQKSSLKIALKNKEKEIENLNKRIKEILRGNIEVDI
jgi:predicted Holliday junction resolvase-like endonuclease